MQAQTWKIIFKLCALLISFTYGRKNSSVAPKMQEVTSHKILKSLPQWIPDYNPTHRAGDERRPEPNLEFDVSRSSMESNTFQVKDALVKDKTTDKKDQLNMSTQELNSTDLRSIVNPNFDVCPRMDLTDHDYDICVLHKDWDLFLESNDNKDNNTQLPNTRKLFTRSSRKFLTPRQDMVYDENGDCLLSSRSREVRPYPNYCYGKLDNFNNGGILNNSVWFKFFEEIHGDFMYTFDFVLYDDKHQEVLQTQFWYLIKYLKFLATYVENPMDLVKLVKGYDFDPYPSGRRQAHRNSLPYALQQVHEISRRLDTIENSLSLREKSSPKPVIINNYNNNTNENHNTDFLFDTATVPL